MLNSKLFSSTVIKYYTQQLVFPSMRTFSLVTDKKQTCDIKIYISLYIFQLVRRFFTTICQKVMTMKTTPNSYISWCLSVHLCIYIEKKNQLDATLWFIALMICSCFGHFYAHHQELETICVLLTSMVCGAWLLVVGGQVQASSLYVQEEGCCTTQSYRRTGKEEI